MRLGGTPNNKTGRSARIVDADFQLEPLPDRGARRRPPRPGPPATTRARRGRARDADPYKRIPPPEYFEQLAGIEPTARGFVRCPTPAHPDRNPSCSVRDRARGCGCQPAGRPARSTTSPRCCSAARGAASCQRRAFKRARAYVADVFGELT